MVTQILRILALLISGVLIFVGAMEYGFGQGYTGYGQGYEDYAGQGYEDYGEGYSGYSREPDKLPDYPREEVYKITQISNHLLEGDAENGYNFTLSSRDLDNLCFRADAGSSDNPPDSDPVAYCMVETSDGKTHYMNLMKIRGWKKVFYVKDTTGNGNYVMYFEGAAAPEEKKGFRLFSFGRKSGKNNSKV